MNVLIIILGIILLFGLLYYENKKDKIPLLMTKSALSLLLRKMRLWEDWLLSWLGMFSTSLASYLSSQSSIGFQQRCSSFLL